MFLHSQLISLRNLLEQDDDSRNAPEDTGRNRCERRLSIMSLLGEQLEREAVLESRNQQPKATAAPFHPKLQRVTNAPLERVNAGGSKDIISHFQTCTFVQQLEDKPSTVSP
jgi:hypothetical protein